MILNNKNTKTKTKKKQNKRKKEQQKIRTKKFNLRLPTTMTNNFHHA